MVQPLVNWIVSEKGLPFLIIVTAVLHFVSTQYWDCGSFFMLIWTVLGGRIYANYVTFDVFVWIANWIDELIERTFNRFRVLLTTTVQDITHGVQELGASLQTGTNFTSIANEFSKHRIGLGCCAKTISSCESIGAVVEETIKISSLLGLETSIVHSTLGHFTSIAGNALESATIVQHAGLDDFEKFIPLVASTAAALDVEFGEMQIGKHMDKFARNTKSAEVLAKHMREVAEATGLVRPQNYQVLKDLNDMVNALKEEHKWIVSTLALHGSLFVIPANYKRVKAYREAVDKISKVLRSINIPDIKNNQIVTECNTIIFKANDYIDQIESIRQKIGLRPVPVGICIKGPSQIGKTTVVRELMKRVKLALRDHEDLFGNSTDWAQWDANQREDFDSGYCGQEIVYMDDAFQDKTNKDHLMWYTYISSASVGTIQGIAEQKGLPFRALICITTCNDFPTKSVAVSHINALHQRFPLTYTFKKVKAFSKWDEGGSDFNHLEIQSGTMAEFAAEIPTRTSVKGETMATARNFPLINLDGMVDQIVKAMVNNMQFFNLRMQTSTTVPLIRHGPESDEEDEDPLDEYLESISLSDADELNDDFEAEFGEIDAAEHSDPFAFDFFEEPSENEIDLRPFGLEDHLETLDEESISEKPSETLEEENTDPVVSRGRHVTFNDVIEEQEPPETERIPPVTVRGSQWSISRVDELARAVAEDMNSALHRVHPDSIDSVGNWIDFLVKTPLGKQLDPDFTKWERVNREDFRRPDGLYDFLSTLGAWTVPTCNSKDFENAFAAQRILKCQDQYDFFYLWGPAFSMGTVLYLVSENLRQQLEDTFLVGWRRQIRGWQRKLVSFLCSHRARRAFAIQVTPIAMIRLFPSLGMTPTFVASFWMRQNVWAFYSRADRVTPFWNSRRSLGGVLENVVRAYEIPYFIVGKAFEYIEAVSLRMTRGLTHVMLQLLEYFGVDVSGYWREIADVTSTLLAEVIILGISSILIYVVYRLIKLLFKKPEELERHESKNEFGKGSKRLQKAQKDKQKRLQVKTFQRRSADEFICEEECDEENGIVEHEDIIYTKIGICNDKQSFYGEKPLKYCFDMLEESPDSKICEFVRDKNSHIVANFNETDDFLVGESQLDFIKRIAVTVSKQDCYGAAIQYRLVGTEGEVVRQHIAFLENLKSLHVLDWQGEIHCRRIDETYHLKVYWVGLTTTIQGTPRKFTKQELKDLNSISEEVKGLKERTSKTAFEILNHHGSDDSITLMKSLVQKHQVLMSIAELDDIDSRTIRRLTYGLGHKGIIILNAHVYSVGEIVRFWRFDQKSIAGYQVAIMEANDVQRDVGFARIITKERLRVLSMAKGIRSSCNLMSPMIDHFRSLEPHLCNNEEWTSLVDDQSCLCFLPTSNVSAVGRMSIEGVKTYSIKTNDGLVSTPSEFFKISQLNLSLPLARKGDCGGIVLSYKDRYQSKVVGFHCGGTASNWFASILRKEDLDFFVHHGAPDDSFNDFIVRGAPVDLPPGPECVFLGKYKYKTKPAGQLSLAHWKYSPFHEQFEEQLQPAPLDANDSRILIDIPRNSLGFKSLLLIPNGIMCDKLPDMDLFVLKRIEEQLVCEMNNKIGHVKTTPSKLDELLELGLNGDRENEFCTGMELNKACGLPWNELPGCAKKSDFLNNSDGFITFKDEPNGLLLKNRVVRKILQANEGERLISLSNSKLKDALIKTSAVEAAKTRVFHCIPVDKVICDAALFGNFKEAYSQAFLHLNHAIGVNPHSLQWKAIYEHLNKHPNVFDMDFSNYDKHLHQELMHTAFRIIRRVIQTRAPDKWDQAREIFEEEAIATIVVDYDTVYKTTRGNKSGEYLTTVINCICNDLLSFYTWVKTTNNFDINEFRSNVSSVSFGDDKVESVSDEYAEKYNYFTAKEIMSSIGHIITPGAKDGIERKFCSIDQTQFLKRGISEWEGVIVAPLLQRSIESPFVWTQISTSDHIIWFNLIEQTLFEALLHGQAYYDSFRGKLSHCLDLDLRRSIASLISVPYDTAKSKYLQRYYNQTSHLCT